MKVLSTIASTLANLPNWRQVDIANDWSLIRSALVRIAHLHAKLTGGLKKLTIFCPRISRLNRTPDIPLRKTSLPSFEFPNTLKPNLHKHLPLIFSELYLPKMTEEKESWESLLDKKNYISNDELTQFKLAIVWRLRFFILLGFSISTLLTLVGVTLYLSKLPQVTSSPMDRVIQPYCECVLSHCWKALWFLTCCV